MLALIALSLFGVGVIAVAAVLLRSASTNKARKARDLDPELAESEVYKKLYGKRLLTVSAPVPAEAPAKADAESAQTPRAMSEENVELARRGIAEINELYKTGDFSQSLPRIRELCDPDFVLRPSGIFPENEEMRGPEGLLKFIGGQA